MTLSQTLYMINDISNKSPFWLAPFTLRSHRGEVITPLNIIINSSVILWNSKTRAEYKELERIYRQVASYARERSNFGKLVKIQRTPGPEQEANVTMKWQSAIKPIITVISHLRSIIG
uniref:Uncharacterized protein n=1 Tax=Steinernema glaseri TaxID=37863 RepID=A0A1I8AHM0_9BILA